MKRIAVTGGAGFLGSAVCLALKRHHENCSVVAFDNLRRRGSELNVGRLLQHGVEFVHGDVRDKGDLDLCSDLEAIIHCAAEPSVRVGTAVDVTYAIDTNLLGTLNCLEKARRDGSKLVFVSTNRIYSIRELSGLPLVEEGERFEIAENATGVGWSGDGIDEGFSTAGPRSIYGATKLASELLVEEYAANFGIRSVILRPGVICGPWQMGKVNQGVVSLWIARHLFGGSLSYEGYGGRGLQVRDVLHVEDICDALTLLLYEENAAMVGPYNIGGGPASSVSLRELTRYSQTITGKSIDIGERMATGSYDIPWYVTDNATIAAKTGWTPSHSLEQTIEDIARWAWDNRALVEPILTRQ